MTHDNPKQVIDHEGESTKILADVNYANTMEPTLGLTYLQLEAMRLLSMPDDYKLSDNQAKLVSRFVESAKGDAALNMRLKKLITYDLAQYGLNREAVDLIKMFADKTRHASKFSSAFDKLNQSKAQPLTLTEYAVMLDFLKTKKLFEFIQSKIELEGDLALLAQKVTKMPAILTALEEEFEKVQPARPSTLLFDHASKTFPYYHLFTHLVTKHVEVMPQTEKSLEAADRGLNMRDYLYSNNYSMKIESLLSEKNQSLLFAAFGPDWLNEVGKMYENLEREVHDDLFRQYAGIKAPTAVPVEAIEHNGRMICSEFLALTTVTALNKLDIKLKEALKNKRIAAPEQLIEIPFSKQENLPGMAPRQAINILTEKGCIAKHQQPRDQFRPKV